LKADRKEWMQKLRAALDAAEGDPAKQARLYWLLVQETMELDYNERGIPEADRVVLRQRHQALKQALMDMLGDSKKGRR
jgi:hypothetical protein